MDVNYLEHLNVQQRAAATFGLNELGKLPSPLLVIAGAGSGKTSTLAHRVAHTIVSGGDPSRIMLLTFSRRAAAEMVNRATKLVGKVLKVDTPVDLMWSGTFHSIAARLLREYATTIGLNPDFSIHDRSDSADLLDLVRHELDFSNMKSRFPQKATCLAIYSRTINTQQDLDSVLADAFPWCVQWGEELRQLFSKYVKAKQDQHILDFDDLLLYWSHMMKIPLIAQDLSERFDHVLVDEYQDTNVMQQDILLALKPNGDGVTVVGDDAQSIYRFRAAEIKNILGFPDAFHPPANVITLDQNYRSTQAILNAANAVIGLAEKRYSKNLWSARSAGEKPRLVALRDEAAQANYVAEALLRNREAGDRLRDQAVLFRASHHSGPLEIELARRNIPYVKYGGLKFLDAAHIKDVICVLRWAQNLRDKVSGFRVLKLLPGLGPVKSGRLMGSLSESDVPFKVLQTFSPPAATKAIWNDFLTLIDRLRAPMLSWPADVSLVQEWYAPLLEFLYDDLKGRLADVVQLEQIASTFPTREKFLTELTLDPADATTKQSQEGNLDEDYAILSTVHSVKGLEYSRVFILSCVDGSFPSDLAVGEQESIEEERRLLYVAMTRAKNSLELLLPQNFYVHKQPARGGRHVIASRTRFIPDGVLEHFQLTAWPAATADKTNVVFGLAVDLQQTVKGMWEGKSPP